jgi:hypothetical protein
MKTGLLSTIRAIWQDKYPAAKPRQHHLIEKILLTPVIFLRIFSLANLRPRHPDRRRHTFMDIYVLTWMIVLCLMLIMHGAWPLITMLVAGYRLYDVITYRLFFLFVKSQEAPWTTDVLRRSILIVLFNFVEVGIAFAILYLGIGNIRDSNNLPLPSGATSLYFSLLTMTTVGYGDFVPKDDVGRILVIAQVASSFLLLIVIVPALVSLLTSDIMNGPASPERRPEDGRAER